MFTNLALVGAKGTSCAAENAAAIDSRRVCELYAQSVGVPMVDRSPEFRTFGSSEFKGQYTGCYKYELFSVEKVYWIDNPEVPFGAGKCCSMYECVCLGVSSPPPVSPPAPPVPLTPPYAPAAELLLGLGLATSGTCESNGAKTITDPRICEIASGFSALAVPKLPLAWRGVTSSTSRAYGCLQYNLWGSYTVRFNTAGEDNDETVKVVKSGKCPDQGLKAISDPDLCPLAFEAVKSQIAHSDAPTQEYKSVSYSSRARGCVWQDYTSWTGDVKQLVFNERDPGGDCTSKYICVCLA